MKRPIVRPEKEDMFSPEIPKNMVYKYNVQRLEVAASGEIAWEFSYADVEWDSADIPVKRIRQRQGMLRVWKKVNGEWKSQALFLRPLDVPFAQ